MDRSYDFIIFISKYLVLRRSKAAIFADIIKIVAMFIKKIFKHSKKVKRTKNYVLKCNLYFLVKQDLLLSGKKILMAAKLHRCVT